MAEVLRGKLGLPVIDAVTAAGSMLTAAVSTRPPARGGRTPGRCAPILQHDPGPGMVQFQRWCGPRAEFYRVDMSGGVCLGLGSASEEASTGLVGEGREEPVRERRAIEGGVGLSSVLRSTAAAVSGGRDGSGAVPPSGALASGALDHGGGLYLDAQAGEDQVDSSENGGRSEVLVHQFAADVDEFERIAGIGQVHRQTDDVGQVRAGGPESQSDVAEGLTGRGTEFGRNDVVFLPAGRPAGADL